MTPDRVEAPERYAGESKNYFVIHGVSTNSNGDFGTCDD